MAKKFTNGDQIEVKARGIHQGTRGTIVEVTKSIVGLRTIGCKLDGWAGCVCYLAPYEIKRIK